VSCLRSGSAARCAPDGEAQRTAVAAGCRRRAARRRLRTARAGLRLVDAADVALGAHELVFLPREVALSLVQQLLRLPILPRDARHRQSRSLPELVMVDLRHGDAEAVLQLSLR